MSSSKFFAEDKINILYAQIHKVAADHPDDRIVFDFFDDRMDILEYLHTFFRKYPALIPNHVTLRLFQYQANVVTPMGEHTQNTDSTLSLNHGINGRGLIDIDYRQTVKNMGVLAEQLQPLKRGGYIMSNYITPELLDGMRLEKSTAFASQPGYGSSDLGFFQTALKSEVPVAQGCDHAQYRCTSLDKRA